MNIYLSFSNPIALMLIKLNVHRFEHNFGVVILWVVEGGRNGRGSGERGRRANMRSYADPLL